MSTPCQIGVMKPGGKILAVYCHWNEYVKETGYLLKHTFNSKEYADAIVSLGDLSALYKNLEPDTTLPKHTFDGPQPDVTIAYHRDRNDDWSETQPVLYANKKDWLKNTCGCYWYLWDIKKHCWTYCQNSRFYEFPENL